MECFRHNKVTTYAHFLIPGSMGITLEVQNRCDKIISGGGSDVPQPMFRHLHTCICAKTGSFRSREML